MWRYMIVWLIAVSHAWTLLNKWPEYWDSFEECSLSDLYIIYTSQLNCKFFLPCIVGQVLIAWFNDCMLGDVRLNCNNYEINVDLVNLLRKICN